MRRPGPTRLTNRRSPNRRLTGTETPANRNLGHARLLTMKRHRRPKKRPPPPPPKRERFTLSRTPPTLPPASASFVGRGASGRARHLLDSFLRLLRDKKTVYLVLVLLILDQVRRIAGPVSGAAVQLSDVYERANKGPVGHALDIVQGLARPGGRLERGVVGLQRVAASIDGLVRGGLAFTRIGAPFEAISWLISAVRK